MKLDEPRREKEESVNTIPEWISHYLIEKVVGTGTFGRVFLALDIRLDRKVAIKVLESSGSGESWRLDMDVHEARVMAGLDHPGLVPIYDVGQTEEGTSYLVSKYIDGDTLAEKMRQRDFANLDEGLSILAAIARAVHHAHEKGFVHRDVKPENILVDRYSRPYLIDFGLVLNPEFLRRGEQCRMGTPPYMSPEQASGASHRVTGRSDVFGLGVILYEMLTGRAPFSSDPEQFFREVRAAEILPPSSISPGVPRPLEKLCLSALSRRPADRPDAAGSPGAFAEQLEEYSGAIRSDRKKSSGPGKVVPKGLHSFDEEDADFFLYLLPGPRDGKGIPRSVSVWKSRIEATDPKRTFRVGLLYGASGSGKTSFLRSGILPRLDAAISTVFVEADSNTEENLVQALHHRFPGLEEERDLVRLFERISEGEGPPLGCKVLIVLDQFEQYLHRRRASDESLRASLEHCDGERLMSLLVVRDDFWVGASNLFADLAVDIDTGQNAGVVDLFDRKHAEDVLIRFGRSLGGLPPFPEELGKSHLRFVRQVVTEMCEEDRVSPIKIALFVQMFQTRPWTLAELGKVGGMSGLGVLYVKECFEKRIPERERPEVVRHAQRILRALLPEAGAAIKGRSLSRPELREAAGFGDPSPEFENLLYLLVREFRLLSPSQSDDGCEERRYGLAHDYLVPVVRQWIVGDKSKTREGRAELLLRDRSDRWGVGREWRLLPSMLEWLRIRIHTEPRDWTIREREMMGVAGRREAWRACILVGAAILCGVWLAEVGRRNSARELRSRVMAGGVAAARQWEPELLRSRRWSVPLFERDARDADPRSGEAFTATWALYRMGREGHESVVDALLALRPSEFRDACRALEPFDPACREYLEGIAGEDAPGERAFRARMALVLAGVRRGGVDSLVEQWLLMDLPEMMPWSDTVLSLGEDARAAADRRFRLPANYDPNHDYGYIVSARESAKAAVAFAAIADFSKVRESLGSNRRVEQRTYVINFLKPSIIGRHDLWTDASNFRGNNHLVAGLVQAIGEVRWDEIPVEVRPAILENVMNAYRSERAEVHFSARYALGRWDLFRPEVKWSDDRDEGSWFRSESGLELAVIPGVEGRRIAVMATEVSKADYLKYLPLPDLEGEGREMLALDDLPIMFLGADEVFAFCNAVSEREGLEACYLEEEGKWYPHSRILERSGYRIPTGTEWRFACGGGSRTEFFFGHRTESMQWHAWIRENTEGKPRRVGMSRPNAFGLFDFLGNVEEWMVDKYREGTASDNLGFSRGGGDFATPENAYSDSIPISRARGEGRVPIGIRLVRTLHEADPGKR